MRQLNRRSRWLTARLWRVGAFLAVGLIGFGWFATLGCAGSRLDRDPRASNYCSSGEGSVYTVILLAGVAIGVAELITAAVVGVRRYWSARDAPH